MVTDVLADPKDPDEVLDYFWDFAADLDTAGGEAISTHTVTATGVTVDSSSISGTKVIAWLSGGTAGTDAEITYQVVTNNATQRTIERTQLLRIRER